MTIARALFAGCLCGIALSVPAAAHGATPKPRPKCVVPGVVTFSATRAKRALTAAGCTARILRGVTRPDVRVVVTRQSVRPGTERRRGSVVRVRVASPTHCLLVDRASVVFRSEDLVISARDTPFDNPTDDPYAEGSTGEWWSCLTVRPETILLKRFRSFDMRYGGFLHDFAASGARLAFVVHDGNSRYQEEYDQVQAVDLGGSCSHCITPVSPERDPDTQLTRITNLATDGQTITWTLLGIPHSAPWPSGP